MDTAINIENLKKNLGGREVLKGINFAVKKGDIFGYLGPNGAGKTTTIRILLGLLKPDSGKIEILGQDIALSEIKKKTGFVLERDGLYDNMSAEENMQLYAKIYGITDSSKKIDTLLAAMGLKTRSKDKVGTYSKGMRQRLALARAMVHDPEVLILDEPTAGVDPSGQIEIRQIIMDVASNQNRTIFFSSHNLDEVQRICNRIALIDRGNIKIYGKLDKLSQEMGRHKVIIKTTQYIAEPLLSEMENLPGLGFEKIDQETLVFSPKKGTEISDIIAFLVNRGVKIEKAGKKEASLEEIYSAVLKEVES